MWEIRMFEETKISEKKTSKDWFLWNGLWYSYLFKCTTDRAQAAQHKAQLVGLSETVHVHPLEQFVTRLCFVSMNNHKMLAHTPTECPTIFFLLFCACHCENLIFFLIFDWINYIHDFSPALSFT